MKDELIDELEDERRDHNFPTRVNAELRTQKSSTSSNAERRTTHVIGLRQRTIDSFPLFDWPFLCIFEPKRAIFGLFEDTAKALEKLLILTPPGGVKIEVGLSKANYDS